MIAIIIPLTKNFFLNKILLYRIVLLNICIYVQKILLIALGFLFKNYEQSKLTAHKYLCFL